MSPLPPLPLDEWRDTKDTLHLFVQVVGKVRLALHPWRNHWWHAALYVSPVGLTTHAIPYGDRVLEIDFDFAERALTAATSDGGRDSFALPGLSVKDFYERTLELLHRLEIEVEIKPTPYGVPMDEPFTVDATHASYDREYVERFYRALVFAHNVLQEFAGRFGGKASPVHLFWHSLDLAYTRFSGRRAPELPDADAVTREAYSHEVISFGFWAGDDRIPFPAFYSYTAPAPDGLTETPLRPATAYWQAEGGPLALLPYDVVRTAADPAATLLDFFESAYEAGAKLAAWDVDALRAGPL